MENQLLEGQARDLDDLDEYFQDFFLSSMSGGKGSNVCNVGQEEGGGDCGDAHTPGDDQVTR